MLLKVKLLLLLSFLPSLLISSSSFSCSKGSKILAIGNDNRKKEFICDIQKALDFVSRDSGGVVTLSATKFIIKKQLVIDSNTTLEGTIRGGDRTTIELHSNAPWRVIGEDRVTPPLIVNSANRKNRAKIGSKEVKRLFNENITIRNLTINGNGSHQKRKWHLGRGHYVLVSLINIKRAKISNLTLLDGLDDAIFMKNGEDITISRCKIKSMGHSGIFLVEVKGAIVKDNRVDVNVNSGVRFFGGSDFIIRNNYIYSTKGYGNYGIQISQAYSNGTPMKNVLIEKNIIKQTPYAGIALYASRKDDSASAVIRDNLIYQCGSKAPNMSEFPKGKIEESGGVNIQSFRDVVISRNTLFNNHGSAIWIDNRFYSSDVDFKELERLPKRVTIRNNIIVGSRSKQKDVYGIEKYKSRESNGSKTLIYNNLFYQNQNGAYSSNIQLDEGNILDINPKFKGANIYRDIENLYKNSTHLYRKFDFRLDRGSRALDKHNSIVIGASLELLERDLNLSN